MESALNGDQIVHFQTSAGAAWPPFRAFDENTRSFVYGLQPCAIQGMFDFDYSCGRATSSVAAMIYPIGGHCIQKFYWGTKETPPRLHQPERGRREAP